MVRRFIFQKKSLLPPLARLSPSVPTTSSLLETTLPTADSSQIQRKLGRREARRLQNQHQNGLNRTFANGCAHLTSANYNSNLVSVARLALPPKAITNARVTKLSTLPVEAVEALGGMLTECKVAPKQLQREADTLTNKLEQRQFPANPVEVRRTRSEILTEIFAENPAFSYEFRNFKFRRVIDHELDELVRKRLAERRYNWKPLKFKDQREAIVYCLSRFGGHFSEMKRVLAEFDRNGFVPRKVLDFGSGLGSGFWAAFERWGDNVQEYSLIDNDLSMRHFSIDLSRGRNFCSDSTQLVSKNLFFRKELFPSPKHSYDLVILHRTLIEMPSQEERQALIEKLWKRTNRYLVIVESSMAEAFRALIRIRDFVLTAGYDFDPEMTRELLYEHGKLDQDTIELFADKEVEIFEKYCRARELLPENVKIPTRIEPGHVFAPCPHDQGCPMRARKEVCKFSTRWQEFRADHKTTSANKDGTLRGSFCFVILEKGERSKGTLVEEQHPRILHLERHHRCVACRVCTASEGLQRFTVGKRAGKIYARIRRAMPSQLLPVQFNLVKNEQEVASHSVISPLEKCEEKDDENDAESDEQQEEEEKGEEEEEESPKQITNSAME